jgi:hypothetical protein
MVAEVSICAKSGQILLFHFFKQWGTVHRISTRLTELTMTEATNLGTAGGQQVLSKIETEGDVCF